MPGPAYSIRPLVSYPRQAAPGERYLMTVDLEPAQPDAPWPYEEEEIVVHCIVDGAPLFSAEVVDDAAVVVHRFGGSYGPARYILTAAGREMEGSIHLALLNAGGVPVGGYTLDGVRISATTAAPEVAAEVPAAPGPAGPVSALVLRGEIVTFDDTGRVVLEDGALYVADDGRIAAVQPAGDPAPSGFADARVLDTDGVIYPGLIDLHVPLGYAALGLWVPPERTKPFGSRTEVAQHPDYREALADPLHGLHDHPATLMYGEVKALVGGATTVHSIGPPTRNARDLLRDARRSRWPGAPPVRSVIAARFRAEEYERIAGWMADGSPVICTVAEGTRSALRAEFERLEANGCLRPELLALHAVALTREDVTSMGEARATLVWCPFSNLWWFGTTADVVAARSAGVRLCLASDWSLSGTKNPLGALKVADLLNRELGSPFDARELCEMVTVNPAAALRWDDHVGRLAPGLLADVLVVARRHSDPFRNLIEAVETDVRLVTVGGRPRYGVAELMTDEEAEEIDLGVPAGEQWRLATADGLSLSSALFELGSDLRPVDSLAHDADFVDRVLRNPLHGGRLDALATYFKV